jgi:trans-2,3-dihydro-3-hydroxyanthranilate isomerase
MHSYVIVDVFTDVPLEGNPVAVFTDASGLAGELMQRTARELNLSESVFVDGRAAPAVDGGTSAAVAGRTSRDVPDAAIRIFTPSTELPFAGHPVLGTAYVVGSASGRDSVTLQTEAGPVPVALRRERGRIVYGEMEQPIPSPEPVERVDELLAALGVERSELPVRAYRQGPLHVYVSLPSEADVQALEPNLDALRSLGAVGVNCFAGEGTRFKTRMFGPGLGVSEDPATGSAAGALALHLARQGAIDYGRRIEISQGAEIGRPSILYAQVDGSDERPERVLVGGSAVIVARGEYLLG